MCEILTLSFLLSIFPSVALDELSGDKRETKQQSYEELVQNYMVYCSSGVCVYMHILRSIGVR